MGRKAKHLQDVQLNNDGYLIRKSKSEDEVCARAVLKTIEKIKETPDFNGIKVFNVHKLFNKDIVKKLKDKFPDIEFGQPSDKTYMMPDGGITFITDTEGKQLYPILIVEMKSQGTNDERKKKGLSEQARGNAIERLGKNVIGFRTYLIDENIMPFVCFGDGCDFDETSKSTIPDRVLVISMYGKLGKDQTINQPPFNRGSFYFRKAPWTEDEIIEKTYDIATRSIFYYFSKYGKTNFIK